MLRFDVIPWPRGKCEAGVGHGPIGRLPACDKRGRWMVGGVILCGSCKREVVVDERKLESA